MTHQYIRLFRDIELGGDGGEPVFDADKINAQLVSIEDIQDTAYCLGIDHAIEVVRKFLSQMPGLHEPLIEKLEKLKTK